MLLLFCCKCHYNSCLYYIWDENVFIFKTLHLHRWYLKEQNRYLPVYWDDKKLYLRIKCFLQCIWCKKGLPLIVVPQCEMNTALYIKVSYGISFYLIISQNVHNKLKMLPNPVAYLPAIFCCCQWIWKFDKYSSLNDFCLCLWEYEHNTIY